MEQAPDTTFAHLAEEALALCAHIRGAECRLIELIGKLDATDPWPSEEPDCAHWLAHHGGLDLVTAREKVRIARALDALPEMTSAFQSGELSYSKVRAITRIAEPDTESELVELAKHDTAENVVRIVRARRQADHLSVTGAALNAWKHRYLDCHSAQDGSVVFEGRLPAELGALLLQALGRASEYLYANSFPTDAIGRASDPRPAEEDPARQPAQARRADALALLAERFLATSPSADANPNTASDNALNLNTGDRFLITVHASAEALRHNDNSSDVDDPPRFEDGSVAASETVRRLACDASVVPILERSRREPLDVGRKTRIIPPALRRALKRRDGGCRFPGCSHTLFLDGHHVKHWPMAAKRDSIISLAYVGFITASCTRATIGSCRKVETFASTARMARRF